MIPFDLPIVPMEAKVSTKWPLEGWAYEPKWDGFRSIASGKGARGWTRVNSVPCFATSPN
ncbi:MAG: hypothetical protein O3B42_05090 [Actinomycetota bacterium]|nr:hypothetical protein [Actinomycetota bacterium]